MSEEEGDDPIEELVTGMLSALGEDPRREGLLRAALGDRLHGVRLRQDEDLWVDVVGDEAP